MTGRGSRSSSRGEVSLQPLGGAEPPTASQSPLSTQRVQLNEDASATSPASTPPVAPVAQILHTRLSTAYTCVAPAQRGWADGLVAGTAGGRLRWLDLERGCSCADVYCHPISRWLV